VWYALMFRIWREPEVVVRSGGEAVVNSTDDSEFVLADMMRVEPSIWDSFWLCRPQMNGYNVHDGACDELSAADLW
jgi:hypothetical protein